MDNEFTPYKESFELKELGFDEPCFGEYQNGSWDISENDIELILNMPEGKGNFPMQNKCCTAPIYSQAFKFFREKHNLDSWIKKGKYDDYIFEIFNWGKDSWDTYEEAELACLNKLIEIVKNK